MTHRIDIIGDIHGQLGALEGLRDRLGYSADWEHRDGRLPVFLGDLIDRGDDAYDVANIVRRLVAERRAVCLMGNHEYNLVAYTMGLDKPNRISSSRVEYIADRQRWRPLIDFFETLPLSVDLPDLRIIHACWHLDSYAAVQSVLGCSPPAAAPRSAFDWVVGNISLSSPFSEGGLNAALPPKTGSDRPHEILIKGFEEPAAAPFPDIDGELRDAVRVTWWTQPPRREVPHDKRTVFGHYWNVPGFAAPPHPTGHPTLREWQELHAASAPASGSRELHVDEKFVCVDYNGVLDGIGRPCIGAYRYPEHAIVWAGAK